MKKASKNILGILGTIFTVAGILGAVPFFLIENYPAGTGSTIIVLIGLVLLGLAFSD